MEEVVIVSGVRTAIGTLGGALSETSASDLGAAVIREAVKRAGLTPEQVDQVILGCVGQVAEDGYIARHASVKGGMPIGTPAYTVNRICGSGLEAINTAARWLQTGDAEVVVAGGTENMSDDAVLPAQGALRLPLGDGALEDGTMHLVTDPFENVPMGITAENLAERVRGLARSCRTSTPCARRSAPAPPSTPATSRTQILPLEVTQGPREGDRSTPTSTRARPRMEALGQAARRPSRRTAA